MKMYVHGASMCIPDKDCMNCNNNSCWFVLHIKTRRLLEFRTRELYRFEIGMLGESPLIESIVHIFVDKHL